MLDVIKSFLPTPPAGLHAACRLPPRRPPRACDNGLTGTARRWLRSLPARRRPLRLCIEHPRVANRIAWVWRDPVAAAQVLDDLLLDSRGGRRGFGVAITRELQRLRGFNDQQRVENQPESFWSAVGRVIGAD